jgi:diaminopimelate decarboxylase
MCDKLRVRDVFDKATYKPFYLMSKSQLRANFEAYQTALEGLDLSFIGYAVKANHNMHVLRYLASLGSGAVLVSGNELKTAIKAGFDTNKMVFNGNGKMLHELEYPLKMTYSSTSTPSLISNTSFKPVKTSARRPEPC